MTPGLRRAGVALALLAAACGDSAPAADERPFGPMAVVDGTGVTGRPQALGGTGPILIGRDCVTLDGGPGRVLLLAWLSTDVAWDAGSRIITFTHPGSEPIRLSDGDIVTVGGADLNGEDGPMPPVAWLAPPHASCPRAIWGTAGLELVEDR